MNFKPVFFYEPGVADVAAPVQAEEKPSIASLMATQGKLGTDSMVEAPISDTEKTDIEKQPEVANAASATTPSDAVQENSGTPSPTEVEVKATTPAIPETPIPQPTWQEVLKQQQPETVFKELGLDDKVVKLAQTLQQTPEMVALYEAWANKGDLTPYLKAVTTDYNKMQAEELMRHQLLGEYPQVSNETINALYKRRVIEAYNLDSDDPEEVAEGRLLLDADSIKVREKLISEQQKFLTPKPPEPKAEEPKVDTAAIQRQKAQEDFEKEIKDSSLINSVLSSKQLIVGDGEDKFTYTMEKPQDLVDLMLDTRKWVSKLFNYELNADGSVKTAKANIPKQLMVAAILNDDSDFFNKYNAHQRSLGSKSITDSIENASTPANNNGSSQSSTGLSIAAQLAKSGRITN